MPMLNHFEDYMMRMKILHAEVVLHLSRHLSTTSEAYLFVIVPPLFKL